MAAAAKKGAITYQFKICIKGSKPLIWRRIEVPENYTFYELHVAIQDAIQSGYAHQWHIFEMGKAGSDKIGECIGIPDECGLMEILPEKEERISNKFNLTNNTCTYSYRSLFDDYQNHIVTLENILPELPNVKYPRCITGRNTALAMIKYVHPHDEDELPVERVQRFSAKNVTFRDPKEVSDSETDSKV